MERKASIKLIRKATEEDWLKILAVYHLLKVFYSNSCIYDYRRRRDEIAKTLGVSVKTWYNYLHQLRSLGLVYNHADNLCLKSIRDFGSRTKCTLLIDKSHTLQDITNLLYGKVIERKAQKQAFSESLLRFRRGDSSIVKRCASPFWPSLSSRTVAKLLNVSEFKARAVLKNLERLEVIQVHKQKPKYITSEFIPLEVLDDFPGRFFKIGSRLFRQFGMRVEFLQYPVEFKPMTLRVYKTYNRYRKQTFSSL